MHTKRQRVLKQRLSLCLRLPGFRPVMAVIPQTLLLSAASTLDRRRGSSAPQVSKGPEEVRQAGTCGWHPEHTACMGLGVSGRP